MLVDFLGVLLGIVLIRFGVGFLVVYCSACVVFEFGLFVFVWICWLDTLLLFDLRFGCFSVCFEFGFVGTCGLVVSLFNVAFDLVVIVCMFVGVIFGLVLIWMV